MNSLILTHFLRENASSINYNQLQNKKTKVVYQQVTSVSTYHKSECNIGIAASVSTFNTVKSHSDKTISWTPFYYKTGNCLRIIPWHNIKNKPFGVKTILDTDVSCKPVNQHGFLQIWEHVVLEKIIGEVWVWFYSETRLTLSEFADVSFNPPSCFKKTSNLRSWAGALIFSADMRQIIE